MKTQKKTPCDCVRERRIIRALLAARVCEENLMRAGQTELLKLAQKLAKLLSEDIAQS